MKIRTGFISNSSTSSYYLVYIPDEFDFDIHKEYLLDHFKTNKSNYLVQRVRNVSKSAVNKIINGILIHEADEDGEVFYNLKIFLDKFIFITEDMEEDEGNSIIEPVSETQVSIKARDKIEKFVKENNEKFKDVIEKKKKKKKEIRELTQHIDPYDEEEWEDEFSYESFKIKKFNEI